MIEVTHIPEEERRLPWFLLIEPLVNARCSRDGWQKASFVLAMQSGDGWGSWHTIKMWVELALRNASGAESIFSRASQIRTDPDPDGVIGDMFAEARAIPYLLAKGFENLGYQRRDGLDFSMEFSGKKYNCEVAYVRGKTFKTQTPRFKNLVIGGFVYELGAKKLISRLKTICDRKEAQATKHGGSPADTIVFIISDLGEIQEPWLDHDTFQGQHPILGLVTSRRFPTVVFGSGTVYEPEPAALGGIFSDLLRFDWAAFEVLVPRRAAQGGQDVSS